MAVRNVVKIDEEKCTGCGLCVNACAEGAIQVIDGKARLVSEIYCDGLGACLNCCPVDAITIEQRDAADFDEKATRQYLEQIGRNQARHQEQVGRAVPTRNSDVPVANTNKQQHAAKPEGFVCPGMRMMTLEQKKDTPQKGAPAQAVDSQLGQWPVQLHLVSPAAPYFAGADLMLVADCVPFAMGDFHPKLLKGKAIAIACPKLDDTGMYAQKIADILTTAKPRSLTVVHMQVPCCSGLVRLAHMAVALAQSDLEIADITIGLHGNIIK